jgi:hypothetical protein
MKLPRSGHLHRVAASATRRAPRGVTNLLYRLAIGRHALSRSRRPPAHYRSAARYSQAGLWAEAQRLLSDQLDHHHAASHRELASAARMVARWGGTFIGTLDDRRAGKFAFDADQAAAMGRLAVEAHQRAVHLHPDRIRWRGAYADALHEVGRSAEAAEQYTIALEKLETSTDLWTLDLKQKWQFHLERIHDQHGRPRVVDPLFACTVQPTQQPQRCTLPVAGLLFAQFSYAGLTISGMLAASDATAVDIYLNGAPIRTVNVSGDGHFPRFTITFKRDTVALLPEHATLEARTSNGEGLLGPGAATSWTVNTPHGNGKLLSILQNGGKLDKKGTISPSPAETAQRQECYLEVYSQLRDFFNRKYGRPVFLMYGTLLGYHREGDFIKGDDDFDAGYVSDRTDPQAVKEEAFEVIIDLIRAGFAVSFNRKGRLLRVSLEDVPAHDAHIDLRPLWFQDGNLWAHNHVCLPLTRSDFLPTSQGKLRGVAVDVPRDAEAFLRGHYGPEWMIPDPGFIYYPSAVDPAVRRNLDRALITVAEYRKLAARIERECADLPGAGRFVSLGSQDLYPLDSYIGFA